MKTNSTKIILIRSLILPLSILILWNCKSPKSALEKEQFTKAMNLSSDFIEKGQDVEENTKYLQTAAHAIAKKTLQEYAQQNSSEFGDWKRSQDKLYRVLDQLGKRNIKTNGLISESYDMVCEVKQEIDLKIINYFYDEGVRLLDESISGSNKMLARDAYQKFISAENESAALFYSNLEELKAECILHGSITVDAPNEIRYNNLFLKPFKITDGDVADCSVSYYADFANFTTNSIVNVTELRNDIVVGQNSVVDTSGIVTFENITQEVVGFRNETTFSYLLTQNLSINVVANTSECFLNSRSVVLSEPETCNDVRFTGDRRAFTTIAVDNICNEFLIKNTLEQRLYNTRINNLYVN